MPVGVQRLAKALQGLLRWCLHLWEAVPSTVEDIEAPLAASALKISIDRRFSAGRHCEDRCCGKGRACRQE